MARRRMTVSVDPELASAGAAAVAEGRAESLSSWVNEALADKVAKERRLAALAEAVAAYEADHGRIGSDELTVQTRADREAAAASRAGAMPPSAA